MRNAIPFKAEAVLTLPKENIAALKEMAADWQETFNDEFKLIEPQGIEVLVEDVATPAKEVPVEITWWMPSSPATTESSASYQPIPAW